MIQQQGLKIQKMLSFDKQKINEITMNRQQKVLSDLKIARDLESMKSFLQDGEEYHYVFSNFLKKKKIVKKPEPQITDISSEKSSELNKDLNFNLPKNKTSKQSV